MYINNGGYQFQRDANSTATIILEYEGKVKFVPARKINIDENLKARLKTLGKFRVQKQNSITEPATVYYDENKYLYALGINDAWKSLTPQTYIEIKKLPEPKTPIHTPHTPPQAIEPTPTKQKTAPVKKSNIVDKIKEYWWAIAIAVGFFVLYFFIFKRR